MCLALLDTVSRGCFTGVSSPVVLGLEKTELNPEHWLLMLYVGRKKSESTMSCGLRSDQTRWFRGLTGSFTLEEVGALKRWSAGGWVWGFLVGKM